MQHRGANTFPGSSDCAAATTEEAEALTLPSEIGLSPEATAAIAFPGPSSVGVTRLPAGPSAVSWWSGSRNVPETASLEASASVSAALARSPARDASRASEIRRPAEIAEDRAADMSSKRAENWVHVRQGTNRRAWAADRRASASCGGMRGIWGMVGYGEVWETFVGEPSQRMYMGFMVKEGEQINATLSRNIQNPIRETICVYHCD